jgi:hypothetical protein
MLFSASFDCEATTTSDTAPGETMNLLVIVVRVFLFALVSIVFLIGFIIFYASRHTDAEVGQLSVLLIVAGSMATAALVVFGPVALRASTNRRPAAEKLDQLIASTRAYIETLERSRAFVAVEVPGLHLEQREFTVRHDPAKLAEFRSARVGGGVGTRVRVGGFPIYLGGWKSAPMNELREVGVGDLVLTNRRLLFLGVRHTLTIPFDHLLTCEQKDPAGLVVSKSRSKTPHVFFVENEGLWCFLVNWLADNRFEDPKLPDGIHLSVTGEAPKLRVEVNRGCRPGHGRE